MNEGPNMVYSYVDGNWTECESLKKSQWNPNHFTDSPESESYGHVFNYGGNSTGLGAARIYSYFGGDAGKPPFLVLMPLGSILAEVHIYTFPDLVQLFWEVKPYMDVHTEYLREREDTEWEDEDEWEDDK